MTMMMTTMNMNKSIILKIIKESKIIVVIISPIVKLFFKYILICSNIPNSNIITPSVTNNLAVRFKVFLLRFSLLSNFFKVVSTIDVVIINAKMK
mgnify:CR=1 FL=1